MLYDWEQHLFPRHRSRPRRTLKSGASDIPGLSGIVLWHFISELTPLYKISLTKHCHVATALLSCFWASLILQPKEISLFFKMTLPRLSARINLYLSHLKLTCRIRWINQVLLIGSEWFMALHQDWMIHGITSFTLLFRTKLWTVAAYGTESPI